MKKYARLIVTLSLMFAMVLSFAGLDYAASSQKTLQAASYKYLKGYMTRLDKSKFAKVVDLGNLATYRQELSEVKIVVNTRLKSVAMYDPNKDTIYISKDPSRITKKEATEFGETLWHELTHKIEDTHGDIGILDSQAYAERNIEYMTYISRVALPVLEKMENDKNASPEKIRKYWSLFLKKVEAVNNLPEVRKYPPNREVLEKWFGFKFDASSIEKFYKSGSGGSRIKSALVPAASWDGSWSTSFGQMTLTSSGNSVAGTYAYQSGRLNGTISGNVLTGTWVETDDRGTFSFTISSDGKSFAGSWRETEPSPSQAGSWNGSR